MADGEVFDSAKLKNTIRFLIENDMRNIVIDLGNLEYLYSDTINAFIASNRHMLEVSGRIAILTEHPKVQDILKRAGLDNIMRIYRSEAEMIADAKEILRQTSSYRIDELQKAAASSQGTVQLPPQVITPPPIPKGEFEEFRFEMGQQLGTKLDNNEVPQYQYGANAQAAAAAAAAATAAAAAAAALPPVAETPSAPPSGYPANSQPTAYSPPSSYPSGFIPPNPPPAQTPDYGSYAKGGYASPSAASPQDPETHLGPGANSGFDFPTVQLPIGSYSQPPQVPKSSQDNALPDDPQPQENDLGSRGRIGAEDRMRSPNARKAGSRRVGGREGAAESLPTHDEAFNMPQDAVAPPSHYEPQTFGATSDESDSQKPIVSSSGLIEEGRSSGKLVIFALLFLVAGIGLWFITRSGDEAAIPETTPPAQAETPPETPSEPVAPDTGLAAMPQEPVEPPPEPVVEAPPPPEPKPAPIVQAKPRPVRPKAARPAPVEPAVPTTPVASETPAPSTPSATPAAEGQIRIISDPAGADVLVNFSKKGVTPLNVSLGNNTNRIIVKKEGFKRYETTISKNTTEKELIVELTPDEDAPPVATPKPPEEEPKAEIKPPEPVKPKPEPVVTRPKIVEPPPEPIAKTPDPEPPAPAPSKPKPASAFSPGSGPAGVIFLSSSPARADILVDGKETGKKTPAKMELPSGLHRIEMVKGGQKSAVDHTVNEGKNKALHLNLQ